MKNKYIVFWIEAPYHLRYYKQEFKTWRMAKNFYDHKVNACCDSTSTVSEVYLVTPNAHFTQFEGEMSVRVNEA